MKKIILTTGTCALIYALIVLIMTNINTGIVVFTGLVLIVIIYGFWFDRLNKIVHIIMVMAATVFFSVISFLALYGNNHTTDFTEDVVFVLGSGLVDDEIQPTLKARLEQALLYYENNPHAIFILCGGYGARQTISEAYAMANFLIAAGIPADSLILEALSTSTYENFAFATQILANYFPDGFRLTIITNNFHMYRAGFLARHFELEPTYFSAPTPFLEWAGNFTRELLAVFNTWLFQT